MIKKQYINAIYLIAIVFLSSCNLLRNITAKDGSGTAKVKKVRTANNLTFMDDIEMLPGGVVVSRHKTSGITTNGPVYHYSEKGGSNIEDAHWLQYKYAIIANTEVESLTNVPLLQKIDEWWGTK